MSSKYNRFFISTCLSVIACSTYLGTPSYAGFDWTPPKDGVKSVIAPIEPVEKMAPVEDVLPLEPISTEPVVQEIIKLEEVVGTNVTEDKLTSDDIVEAAPVKITEPVKDKILVDDSSASIEEDIIIEIPEELLSTVPDSFENTDIPVEVVPAEEKIVVEAVPEEALIVEQKTFEKTQTAVEAVTEEEKIIVDSALEEEPKTKTLQLNPFPLEKIEENKAAEKADMIALPSDEEKNQSGIVVVEDDVILEGKTPETSSGSITWSAPESFDVVEGFGTDMPLVLAISEIVPAQYAYSFSKDVNPGTLVSWEGGEPWNIVLGDLLESVNLGYDLKGKIIKLKKISSVDEGAQIEKGTAAPDLDAEVESIAVESDIIIERPSETDGAIKKKSNVDVIIVEDEATPIAHKAVLADQLVPVTTPKTAIGHSQDDELLTPIEELIDDNVIVNEEVDFIEELVNEEQENPIVSKAQDEAVDISKEVNLLGDDQKINEKQESSILDQPIEEIFAPIQNQDPDDLSDNDEDQAALDFAVIETTKNAAEQVPAISQDFEDNDPMAIANASLQQIRQQEEAIETKSMVDTPLAVLEAEENQVVIPSVLPDVPTVADEAIALDDIVPEVIVSKQQFATVIPNDIKVWQASEGESLFSVLEAWTTSENIALEWNIEEETFLKKDVFISGTFKNALDVLFSKGLKTSASHEIKTNPHISLIVGK